MEAISLSKVRKRYGAATAVDDVDLAVGAGEVVALLGPNGAGKSTTVDLALGLSRPDSGTIRVWGSSPEEACAAGRVGAMLQGGGLIGSLKVRELVDLVRRISPHPLATEEVLRRAGVAGGAERRTDSLSGGEAQRVRFALAIAGDPDLLILDEPTAAMDVNARREFWESIQAWTDAGRTVVFATHHLEEADAFADRVVVMARGRVVADGPTAEVRALASGRTITGRIPGAEITDLAALPGVVEASCRAGAVQLRCCDSDVALRSLLARWPHAAEVEVSAAGIEEAFLALTAEEHMP